MCPLCHDEGHDLSGCPRWRVGVVLLLAGVAHAAPVAVIDSELGSITLDGERGHCVAPARAAVWRSPDERTSIPGCWVLIEGGVRIAFADGDVVAVPLRALRRPAGA